MSDSAFMDAVAKIRERDPRYAADAYLFVREALDFTVKMLQKNPGAGRRHVSGSELVEGIRRYALEEYGPMAFTVLKTWGITTTRDFGNIVFNMVDTKLLGKTDEDRPEDFDSGYDFHEAFVRPFEPATPRGRGTGRTAVRRKATGKKPPAKGAGNA